MPPSTRHEFAERLRDVQMARARLAPLALDELVARLPAEAARACGVDAAVLALVRDGELQAGLIRAPLREHPVEAEVVARCRPRLAGEPLGFAVRAGLRGAGPTAVAPLVHPDRVIGVLYARADRSVDELDREVLWTFAGAVAPLLHLATLADIARSQHDDPIAHRLRPL